jgi:hypothetical protein
MKWTKRNIRLIALFLEFVASMTITILFIYLEFTQKNKLVCDIILIGCAGLFAIAFSLFAYVELRMSRPLNSEGGTRDGAAGSPARSGGKRTSK